MRIQHLLITTALANLFGGALLCLAFTQPSMNLSLVISTVALVASGSSFFWCHWKLRNSLNAIAKRLGNDAELDNSGIVELDELCEKFTENLVMTRSESLQSQKELEEIRLFLGQVDRREFSMDRAGNPISSASQLRGILTGYGGDLEPVILQVSSCGREITRFTEQIVAGTEEQAGAVERATAMIESMADAIVSVSESAETAVSAASTAREVSASGLQQFKILVEEMKQIRNHIAARERKLRTLGQHTQEIGNIVQTIGSLSSKTDLLALNASIESVRAGEHGRGFAIVAQEVRALAEQSAQAVLDISNRIELVQMETQQSISVAAGEHEQISDVIEKIVRTLQELQIISESAADSASCVATISGATQNQLQLTHEIVSILEQNSKLSKGNRNQAEGAHWTAKTLNQMGEKLTGLLDLFRLSGTLSSKSMLDSPNASGGLQHDTASRSVATAGVHR